MKLPGTIVFDWNGLDVASAVFNADAAVAKEVAKETRVFPPGRIRARASSAGRSVGADGGGGVAMVGALGRSGGCFGNTSGGRDGFERSFYLAPHRRRFQCQLVFVGVVAFCRVPQRQRNGYPNGRV